MELAFGIQVVMGLTEISDKTTQGWGDNTCEHIEVREGSGYCCKSNSVDFLKLYQLIN